MLFQASGCNALRAFYVADEADFAFREWFSDRNLNNFSSGNVFGSEFLRKEADSEIMGYHRENLIGGCHFHIRGEWEVVAHEILGVQFSGAAARGDSDEGRSWRSWRLWVAEAISAYSGPAIRISRKEYRGIR